MSTKHTPGPWGIVPRTAPKGLLMIESAHGLVAVMEHSKTRGINYEQAEANARLVALAPELLQILLAVKKWDVSGFFTDHKLKIPLDLRQKMQAVIDKAEFE